MHETILYPTTADNTKALKRFLADIAAHTRLHPQMTELNDPDIAFVEDGAPRTVQVIWLEEVDSDEPLVTSIGVVDEDEVLPLGLDLRTVGGDAVPQGAECVGDRG